MPDNRMYNRELAEIDTITSRLAELNTGTKTPQESREEAAILHRLTKLNTALAEKPTATETFKCMYTVPWSQLALIILSLVALLFVLSFVVTGTIWLAQKLLMYIQHLGFTIMY